MSRARATGSRLPKTVAKTQFLFHADRKSSFKKFIYDSEDGAVCTSDKLAAAGFYSTATKYSPASAKCAFCSKELEFDPEDDPWEEHKKRGQTCEFVKLDKLDEKEWTVRDVLYLGGVIVNNAKYKELQEIVNQMEMNGLCDALRKHTAVETKSTTTRAKRTRK